MKKYIIYIALLLCIMGVPQFSIISAQVITTIAGNGTPGFGGDGGPATSALIYRPWGIALDDSENVYIGDYANHMVRKVNSSTGIITRLAGLPVPGYSGDGGPATAAKLYFPHGVASDNAGNIYVADEANHVIRKITKSTGIITTVAGDGGGYYGSDGVQATSTGLNEPQDIALDDSGNIYICDYFNFRIRKVTAATGIISTIAGNGTQGSAGDGGQATAAQLSNTSGIALDNAGNIYIALANKIRKITVATGIITTIAGTGLPGFSGDGGLATLAQLNSAVGIALDSIGNIYIADTYNYRIRKITASTGIITTIAGTGNAGYNGDGISALTADLNIPKGIIVDRFGCIYFSDSENNRVRKIEACAVGIEPQTVSMNAEIVPDPVSTILSLRINSTQNGKTVLHIINIYGQDVMNISDEVHPGLYSKEINIESLAKGSYLLIIDCPQGIITKSFIKN